ncbi:hypothetical protein D3C84_1135980 [compost metagenome]
MSNLEKPLPRHSNTTVLVNLLRMKALAANKRMILVQCLSRIYRKILLIADHASHGARPYVLKPAYFDPS